MTQPTLIRILFTGRHQRIAIVGATSAFFVVALAGLAAACVPWGGETAVEPAGNITSEEQASDDVHGDYGAGAMQWCSAGSESEPYDRAKIKPSGDANDADLKINVKSRESNCDSGDPDAELEPGTYYVTAVNSAFSEVTGGSSFDKTSVTDDDVHNDCMFRPDSEDLNPISPFYGFYIDTQTWGLNSVPGTFTVADITADHGNFSAVGGLRPSSDYPWTSVAGVCITASEPGHKGAEGIMVPVEILDF